jgi:shikimate kinase
VAGQGSKKRTIDLALEELGDRNLILAGFMGSGKTTVGRILARNLGWDFLDTDREIETRQQMSIPRIFEMRGEEAFRDLETDLAHEMKGMQRRVVSTGGGFMLRPENRKAAAEAGETVLLIATPEQIWHRVKRSRHRPLLQTADPEGRIRELLHQREDAYASIPRRVETGGKTPYSIAEDVLKALIPE